MHRGSSKEAAAGRPTSEALRLCASPTARVRVTFEVVCARQVDRVELELEPGCTVGVALRALGLFREATSALIEGRSVPFDRPLVDGEHLELLRTFSGG